MIIESETLEAFVTESNRIEGIHRDPFSEELFAHERLLGVTAITVEDVRAFVGAIQPNAVLRDREGLNVRVGPHVPLPGGPGIRTRLEELLSFAHRPCIYGDGLHAYRTHQVYETLHPFTDGNGRSGRAVWLWQMQREGYDGRPGFLHLWYYQSLQAGR